MNTSPSEAKQARQSWITPHSRAREKSAHRLHIVLVVGEPGEDHGRVSPRPGADRFVASLIPSRMGTITFFSIRTRSLPGPCPGRSRR